MNNFYVYVYLDSRKRGYYIYSDVYDNIICFKYEPIYIGKGKDNRINAYHKNKYLYNKIKKIRMYNLDVIKIKLLDNISEKIAFEYEMKYIKLIGRKNIKTGPLVNSTNGGEGCNGFHHTEKSKLKMRKKFEYILNIFEKDGLKLLSTEDDYKNYNTKLKYKCNKNHINYMTYNNRKQGGVCPNCYNDPRKKNFYDIIKSFEKDGFELLSENNEYKNAHCKLKYRCKNNHVNYMTYSNRKQGRMCPECINKKSSIRLQGEKNHNSKLNNKIVIQIKMLIKLGFKIKYISSTFSISEKLVSSIKTNKRWKHIIV